MNTKVVSSDSRYEVEIDLLDVANILWLGKKTIVTVTFVFACISVIYALLLPNIYRADAVLAPANEAQRSVGLGGQFSAAANLAGINLNQVSTKTQNAMAIMQSRKFVKNFVQAHGLLVPLMAGKWDRQQGRNIIDPTIFDEASQTWLGSNVPTVPSDLDVFQVFNNIMNVSQNVDTGLFAVSIEWTDPQQASQWVNWLITDINEKVRETDLAEANNAISYLRNQVSTTQLVEMQRVFYGLIETQTRIVMLADVRDEYVFEIIDPAVAPEVKVSPSRAIICILGSILGGVLASFYLLIRRYAS
ncbi:MAG: LPS O-antigen length regulator [SAR86 cluster bacterium]|uniref:LPS O-antigen length regulator n=1 Tax=SAR86 cluster bacterium TaxID=2030880 RepID=A0A2A5AV90_9GAMM|nr:MAG: LPS O-antigen length regulator [SAR86 cluster bacterium]